MAKGKYGANNRGIAIVLAAFVLFLLVWIRQMQGIWRKAEAWKGAGTWNLP